MYCRRCGKRLDDAATSCPDCGTEVVEVKQRPYAEKYRERRQAERAQRAEERAAANAEATAAANDVAARNEAAGIKRDPYLIPSTIAGAVAFGLAMFPWPAAWGVGTSLPMKLAILALALCALVLCFLATRIEDANVNAARAYSKRRKKHAFTYERPKQLAVAQVLAAFSAIMALLSLFTS